MRKITLILFLLITVTTYAQVPSYVPADGLVGWWPFNGNADDESGNGLDGTIYGSLNLTEDRNGNQNKAYSWPSSGGSGNYIFIPDFTNYLTDSYSISFWMLMDGGSINPRIMSKGEWTIGTDGTSNSSRTMTFGGGYVGGLLQQNVGPIEALEWVHVVWTADGTSLTGESKVYINGNLFSSSCCHNGNINPDWTSVNPSDFNIGRKSISAYDSWGGKLDDIGIWNRALTAEEVENLYNTCNLDFVTQPLDLTVNIGEDAEFIVESSNPEAVFQWQTDLGLGFQNLSNAGQFSGVSTSTLIVSNTTMSNNNQHFRCIISSNSCSEISDKAVLNIEDNLSNQIFYKNEIILYPNPVKDKLNVLIDGLLINSIYKIYNMNGRLIFSGKLDKTVSSIDLNNLPKGMYLIRLENKEIIKTSKFIISE